jgi:enterochelin esterase-like enzyme
MRSRVWAPPLTAVLLAGLLLAGACPARAASPGCSDETSRIQATAVTSRWYSRPVAVNVYLPPCYDGGRAAPYPVVYLLHGGNSDETQWPDLNVQIAADALIGHGAPPFVVVMPGGYYYDSVDYEAFVIDELLPGIESQFHVRAARAGRAIGGLSLGGYWALKIAFQRPDVFAAVAGNSPVTKRGQADDPLALAQTGDLRALAGLQIALDAGAEDTLAYDAAQLAQALEARGVAVSLSIGNGGHLRAYWRAHTYDYFSFYLEAIALNSGRGCLYSASFDHRC